MVSDALTSVLTSGLTSVDLAGLVGLAVSLAPWTGADTSDRDLSLAKRERCPPPVGVAGALRTVCGA